MFDIEIALPNRPGALAELGEVLAGAGISVEGGGMFVVRGEGVAHFLVADGVAARNALEKARIRVRASRPVLLQRLRQNEPGQLGKLCRAMADNDVNIELLYSDHAGQLVLLVDAPERGGQVSARWMAAREVSP
ncbi:hypothetical protein [Actinokineospora sp.]|uniref:hypothetical protein n=1 Tax=Actinokineospora sp. TaxID=1872133 RepID=UPI0040380329